MALDASLVDSLFSAVKSHAEQTGLFRGGVEQFEPTNTPGSGLSLSITAGAITPEITSGLDSVSVRIEFMLQIFNPMVQRPLDDIDPRLVAAASVLIAAYCADFTLGGLVREVDLFSVRAQAAYLDADGKEFRVMRVTLPVIVNDAWTEAP